MSNPFEDLQRDVVDITDLLGNSEGGDVDTDDED